MKSELVLCFLFISIYSSAQTLAELDNQMLEYYNKGDRSNAILIAEKSVELARKQFGEKNTEYARYLNNLGSLYTQTGLHDKAEPLLLKAKDIRKINLGLDHQDYIKSLDNIGFLYESSGRYAKAIPYYLEVASYRKRVLGEDHPDYAAIIFNLATIYTLNVQYDKAEPLYILVKEIRKTSASNTVEYAISVNDLGLLYYYMGQYKKSEPLYIEANAVLKRLFGVKDPNYATGLNNLALLYSGMGEYAKAEALYIEAGNIFLGSSGEDHPTYVKSLNNLATLYSKMGQYKKAEDRYLQAAAIRKKKLGESHPDYATSLSDLGLLYFTIDQFAKAEPLLLQASNIYKATLGEQHPDYATALNNLGLLYSDMYLYKKAETLYKDAGSIWKAALGENHPNYLKSLNNLATLYSKMGLYSKAEQLYIQVKELRKKHLGETHPDYATSLNDLGNLYMEMGQYPRAEILLLQAKEIWKRSLGELHTDYAKSLNNIAMLYSAMAQHEKAETLLLQAGEITKKSFGADHSDYAMSLNNLALLYSAMGQGTKAEQLITRALEIWKNSLGENSPEYAKGLDQLAYLYTAGGNAIKATQLLIRVKDILKIVSGEDHPDYVKSLNNLALHYSNTGQFDKAEPLYLQAIAVGKRISDENHLDNGHRQLNLALLYASTAQYKKAEPLIESGTRIVLQNLVNNFTILSEREKGFYLSNNITLAETNHSFLFNQPDAYPEIRKRNFNLQLILRSLNLANTRGMLETIQRSSDNNLKKIYADWLVNKVLLSKQFALQVQSRIPDLRTLETQTEALEKEMNRLSAPFRDQQAALKVDFSDIQKSIEPDEVVIEFVRFRLFNKKWTDSIIYAAYLLTKTSTEPVFIPLFEENQLEELVNKVGKSATETANAFYRGLVKGNKSNSFGPELYKLIWEPLEHFLKSAKKIVYSPAGKLYGIAFHALPVDSSTLLMDKYKLQQYTSLRDITNRNTVKTKPSSIVLFGAPDFTMDSIQLALQRKNKPDSSLPAVKPFLRGSSGAWQSLPATAEEVKTISNLFKQNKITTQSYTGTHASEENLKAIRNNNGQVIHIATHGFFLPDPVPKGDFNNDQNAFHSADDPLLRSGMILAGANYAWTGKPPIDGVEDGIATAYEISQLNLNNTELVVLSACETALGEVKGSEGVFGLQRAFKMAGVKKLIVSLWQVPDKETAELMTLFYSIWMKGSKVRDAFTEAQAEMRKKYSPFYWAAFVLVE